DEYKDLTFSFVYNSGPGTLGVFYPTEQRVAMVSALGLTPDPVIDELKEDYDEPGTDSALIGLENADKLNDSDLLFTFYSDEENRKEVESQGLYANSPAVKAGAVVAPGPGLRHRILDHQPAHGPVGARALCADDRQGRGEARQIRRAEAGLVGQIS